MKSTYLTYFFALLVGGASAQTVNLTYKAAENKIMPDLGTDLNKGSYNFQVNGLNSAYYVVKFNPEYLDRINSAPSGLPTLFLGTTVTPAASHYSLNMSMKMTTKAFAADPNISGLLDEIEKHYDYIQTVVNTTKTLYQNFPSTTLKAADYISKAGDALTAIDTKAGADNIATTTKPGDLEEILNRTVGEFMGDIQTLHDNSDWATQVVPATDLGVIYAREKLVNDKLTEIKNCPTIIVAMSTCVDQIVTQKPFTLESDFFRLNIVVLQNKFNTKPDTLLQQKLVFYRKNYLKFLDISTGFFYNDLYSRSYYYKDTLGHTGTESKSKADVSIGALIHGYYVVSSSFKAGVGLGASVSLLDGKTKYLGGGSIVIGRKQELVLSGGLAVASLPIPSNVLTNGQKFTASNTGGAVPTFNAITWGYFFGISYSLIKL
ncbi:hypothetical protein HDF19_11265 [Mucilaginibacter sp. E4BP6]|uniref:hypothetical protein n=1 Tax=Mucilaginibacter sp. E4BP6 TaxID=2723089 RepID=UPI0015CB9387|nr:hypothetical protein [Mucilaginibacter sp. E4BP6]NYE65263.1 hypothetical protein [Mucilaginibacter sp. E4BP6]